MSTAVKVVLDVSLDEETIREIEMLRVMRLKHYEEIAKNPTQALEKLRKAGLTEESNPLQIAASAHAKLSELRSRISDPGTFYEDELKLYFSTLAPQKS